MECVENFVCNWVVNCVNKIGMQLFSSGLIL